MTARMAMRLAFVLACLVLPLPVEAHRLDEYLQTTRVSVERDHIDLELDLTAGADVASAVFALIDTNRDGRISPAEGEAYAKLVLTSIVCSADEQPLPLTLVDRRFPELNEMKLGTGVIRLRGSATLPAPAATGRHHIYYRNAHKPEIGAYLVNALIPADNRIAIAQQQRDYAQHELTIEYEVRPDPLRSSLWWLLAAVAMAGGLYVTRLSRMPARVPGNIDCA
jgi:hypothetical protein